MNLPEHGKYKWMPILYNLILTQRPEIIVEIGPGEGQTTITMALALKGIGKGKILSYDIWNDNYWGNYDKCIIRFKEWKVDDIITLKEMDFYDWLKIPANNRKFDLLYFDIHNDGTKIADLFNATKSEINNGAIIIFEGGSLARDFQVSWMDNKKKMNDVKNIINYKLLTDDIKYSLSIVYNEEIYDLEL